MGRLRVSGRRATAVLLAAASLSLAYGAAAGAAARGHGTRLAKSPYTLDAIVSVTGTASFLGTQERASLIALERHVNATGGIQGHPLKVNIEDDQTDPSVSVSLASSLIGKVPVLIVGSVTTVDRPVDALVTSSGPVIYDLSPGDHPARGGFVFSASASTTSQTAAFVNYAAERGWKRVAAITSTDASGQDGWNNIQAAVADSKGKVSIVDHETFAPSDVSVTAQLSKIQASNPEAIFVWSTGTPAGTVFQGLQQLGMSNVPVMTTNGNASYAQMQKLASVLPKQLFFPGGAFQFQLAQLGVRERPIISAFDSAMASVGSKVPDEGEALAWDPGQIVVSALRHLGVNASAEQIRTWIESRSAIPGIVGTYDFASDQIAPDNRGIGVNSVLITEWNAKLGRWVGVSGPAGRTLLQHKKGKK